MRSLLANQIDIDTETAPPRLAAAYHAIAMRSVMAISTDVFDTLVYRRVDEPVDVFPLIGARLRAASGLSATISDRVFGALRERAERSVRECAVQTTGCPEVTLAEIYAELPDWMWDARDRAAAIEAEIAVEADIIVPDLDLLALLLHAQEQGKQLLAVSDTYLSGEQLARVLAQPGLGELRFDWIVTSSDERRNKADGLLGIAARIAGLDPDAIFHVGDNHGADIAGAQAAGVRAHHLPRRDERLDAILEREHAWTKPGGRRLAALRAKVHHRPERSAAPDAIRDCWDAGAQVYGPVFAGFAEWVVRRAEASGHELALCLMREGSFLAELIEQAATTEGSSLRTEPLYVNRVVLQRAGIFSGSEEEIQPLCGGRTPLTVEQMLALVGLTPAAVPRLVSRAGASLEDPGLRGHLVQALGADPALRARIVEHSREVRTRLLAALQRATGESERLLLVDLGWGASTQRLLARLYRQVGIERSIDGLYLATHEGAARALGDRTSVSGFLCDFGVPDEECAMIVRSPELLEQICMPDHGTLRDLGPEGEPVLEQVPVSPQQLEAELVRQGIRAFQREYHRYRTQLPDKLEPLSDEIDTLRTIVARATTQPLEHEALRFGAWHHDENAGSARVDPIAPRDYPTPTHLAPRQLRDLPMSALYWPFGLAAAVDPPTSALIGLAARGAIDWEALQTEIEIGPLRIWVTQPHRRAEPVEGDLSVPLYRNRHGLTLARATVRTTNIDELSIRPTQGPSAIRLDALRLALWTEGRDTPIECDVGGADAQQRIEHANCYVEPPNLYVATNDQPTWRIDIPALATPPVSHIDVEIAMAIVPIALGAPTPGRFSDLEHAEHAYRELEQRLAAIEQSRSWRLTRPLRNVRRVAGA